MVTISDKSAIKLHPLERQVLDKLLASTDRELSVSDLKILKIQLRNAIILSREMTGHGFHTRFFVAESALHLPNHHSPWFGAVYADVPGLNHGFQVYIKDGAVNELEGFSHDGPWSDPWPGQFDEALTYEVSELPRSENLETNR